MADYKDIFSGTLRSLGDKVKEVSASGGVKEIYSRGAERAKTYARAAKISLEINGEGEELRKVYAEIGKLFFEQNEAAPGPLYQGLFARAAELRGAILGKEEELRAMKEVFRESQTAQDGAQANIDSFEDIVNATETDGRGE